MVSTVATVSSACTWAVAVAAAVVVVVAAARTLQLAAEQLPEREAAGRVPFGPGSVPGAGAGAR